LSILFALCKTSNAYKDIAVFPSPGGKNKPTSGLEHNHFIASDWYL
tara:strand:+ start:38 stop:175 length:138 start_codon:yes stop_codon:yes gene_type:complete